MSNQDSFSPLSKSSLSKPSLLPLCDPGLFNLFGDLPETSELVSLVQSRLLSACDLLFGEPHSDRQKLSLNESLRKLAGATSLYGVIAPENERVQFTSQLAGSLGTDALTPLVVEERIALILILTGLRRLQGESNPYVALDSPLTVDANRLEPFAKLVTSIQRRYFSLLASLGFSMRFPQVSVAETSDMIVESLFAGDLASLLNHPTNGIALASLGVPLKELMESDKQSLEMIQVTDTTAGCAAWWHTVLPSKTAKEILSAKG